MKHYAKAFLKANLRGAFVRQHRAYLQHAHQPTCSTTDAQEWKTNYTNCLNALRNRGLLQRTFPDTAFTAAPEFCTPNKPTVYIGYDPTADSLHLGHLVTLNAALYLAREGWKVIFLIGGATARLGDPTGRREDRPAISRTKVEENGAKIKGQLVQIVQNFENYIAERKIDALIINNAEWYKDMNCVDFLAEVCRPFRVGTMLKRSSIRERMSSVDGLAFSEFAYQTMQAHDWFELYKRYNCTMQLGGSDQLGNIDAGYHRLCVEEIKPAGLITPLLVDMQGNKIGKTTLDDTKLWLTSAYQMYQSLLVTADDNKRNNDARHVARRLAEEVVRLVHGQAGVDVATEYTNLLYAKDFDCKLLRPDQWNVLATQLPVMQLSFSKTLSKNAIRIVDLAMKTQLYVTRNECEKHVINGGFWVNGQRRSSDVQEMTREQLICDATLPFTLIRKGKRNYLMIKWVD